MAESATANGTTESFSRITEAFFNTDLKRVAALYLDFIENLTKQILDCQESATGWAKETPLEPFVEFQTSITRKLAETSISAVRSFYRLQPAS
jgi:hypothetical protein